MTTLDEIGNTFLRAMLVRMKELGLNKSALARRLNVSRAYVTKVFDGKANFTFASPLLGHRLRRLALLGGYSYHFARALQMDFTPQLTIDPESNPPSALQLQLSTSTLSPNLSTPAFAMA